jgi:predicted permease
MATHYFHSVSLAMLQLFFLGAIGYFLVKRKTISGEGLNGLTRLLIEIMMPALVFYQLVTKFNFSAYTNWWKWMVLSPLMIGAAILIGYLFVFSEKDAQARKEFVSLVGFQNSGYMPLTLVGWIVAPEHLSTILIYLFLFVVGFNLVIWSWGVYFLSSHKAKYFSFSSMFTPPVVATLAAFALILLKLHTRVPQVVLAPLQLLGNCSFPLAMLVVGGTLADLYDGKPLNKSLIIRLVAVKLVLLPLLGLLLISWAKFSYLVSFLIVLELALPSALTLTVIARRYGQQERIISQGVFITHIVSLITLPLILTLFNWIVFRP